MTQKNNEKFILFLATLSTIGLIAENLLMGWEFWVPPIVLVGVAIQWAVNLSGRFERNVREFCYFMFAASLAFYHGIHATSFFDVALVITLAMVVYSIFNARYMMNAFLAEFFAVLLIHLLGLPGKSVAAYDRLTVSRILLHVVIVLFVYYNAIRNIADCMDDEVNSRLMKERIEENDENMEDFLTNISHELRTPVNVVNGMSDLLIRNGSVYEGTSIRNAGMRLSYQIEDIQDYTECKREKVFLDEENYMSTSLINDVVTAFRTSDNAKDLELVVDLDPDVPAMMRGDIRKLHKIFRHLLSNAIKFTGSGGIYVRMYTENTEYGVNLSIEMTDTGIGMDRNAIRSVSEGMYQANRERNRSSGGIGLGLFIVHGFAHRMGGFVKIESEKKIGTMVRVTVPQRVVDKTPCLSLAESFAGSVLFHVRPDKYRVPRLRDFYRNMAANLAKGVHVPLYPAETLYEVERLQEKLPVTHIFMGQEEYEENREYFETLARGDVVVAVSADSDLTLPEGSRVVLMPKPLYAYTVIRILNDGRDAKDMDGQAHAQKPEFKGVRALIVDDEPMNLVVATSIFREYGMIIDTAAGGREAVRRTHDVDYDVIFMDHMMPEMDGVEAMKMIKAQAADLGRNTMVVALTANAVSGAREMFIQEGFDGFIAKPIDTADFERVMLRLLPGRAVEGGEAS